MLVGKCAEGWVLGCALDYSLQGALCVLLLSAAASARARLMQMWLGWGLRGAQVAAGGCLGS